VDAMYAPVALRFITYGIEVEIPAHSLVRAVLGSPAVRDWLSAAREEPESIPGAGVG
jgi:glutathione S-transferase